MAQETPLTPQQEILKAYLDERAKNDELFAVTYAKPNKAFERCWQYIFQQAAKYAADCPGGQMAAIMDKDVFAWAVHYYDEDDLEIDKPKPEPEKKPFTIPTKAVAEKTEKKASKDTKKTKPETNTTSKAKTQQTAGKRAKKAKNEEEDLGLFAGFSF